MAITKLNFAIEIAASPKQVWDAMFGQSTYQDWTSAFCAGSYFEGSWGTGDRIRFLSPDGGGMVSRIAVAEPFRFMSIEHLGYVVNGVDDTESEAIKAWAPAYENYRFTALDSGTRLQVEQDCDPQYLEFMQRTWPLALARLKALCEQ